MYLHIYSLVGLLAFILTTTYARLGIQTKMVITSDTLTPKQFKPGVSVTPLPSSVFYNRFVPIVLVLQAPELSADSLRLDNSVHCDSDLDRDPVCPTAYHFDRVLAPLADLIRFSKNVYAPSSQDVKFYTDFGCDIIEPHFSHLSATETDMKKYFETLRKNCRLASNFAPINKNISNYSPLHIQRAHKKIKALFSKSHMSADDLKLLQMINYESLQSSFIMAKYIDTIRWHNAMSTCQSYRLNIGLVHPFFLLNHLASARKIADSHGYKLSIPSVDFLPQYYKLPITDCILSVGDVPALKKSAIVLRILVPVQKKATKYTRVRLSTIPYLVNMHSRKLICEIDNFSPKEDFLIEEDDVQEEPAIFFSPECYENELCFIPDHPRKAIIDPCIKGLINSSMELIKNHCSFECYPVEHENIILPIIMRVASNYISITGAPFNPEDHITVYCRNKMHSVLNPSNTTGLLQVALPCNCEVRYKTEIFKATRPCEKQKSVEVHYLQSSPTTELYIDHKPEAGHSDPSVDYHHPSQEEDYGSETDMGYKSELPTSTSSSSSGDEKKNPVIVHHNQAHKLQACLNHAGQLGFIWFFVVILLVVNIVGFYVMYVNRLFQVDILKSLIPSLPGRPAPTPVERLRNNANSNAQPPAQPEMPYIDPYGGQSQWSTPMNRL